MGRFYEITVKAPPSSTTPPAAGTVVNTAFGPLTVVGSTATTVPVATSTWSSQIDGRDNGSALDIEFDFFEAPAATPAGNSTLTIHGISLADLQQAQNFAGRSITMKAGMSPGLPLATAIAPKAGLILAGTVYQCFGNWIGTEMTLDLVVVAGGFTFDAPGNFVLNWLPGQTLQATLTTTLANAYPSITPTFSLGGQYSNAGKVALAGQYHTLHGLAADIHEHTATADFAGVDIAFLNTGQIIVTDYLAPATTGTTTQLAFTDLVGQPTWVEPNVMQVTSVMRSDIQVGSRITMPAGLVNAPGFVTTTAQSLGGLTAMKYRSSFHGPFIVQTVRHVGNFRDPQGTSWVTIFQCAAQPTA